MADTRDRILAATNELFRRQGFNGTSLKQVSTASRATIGSIYHFFPGGKDELGAAVVETSGAAYLELFHLIAAEAGPDPADVVTGFFEGAAAVFEETDFIEICPIGTVAREVATTSEAIRTSSHGVFESWIAAVDAKLRGAGLGKTDARDVAVTVVGALEGAFLLCRVGRDAEPVRAVGRTMRRLVETTVAASHPAR